MSNIIVNGTVKLSNISIDMEQVLIGFEKSIGLETDANSYIKLQGDQLIRATDVSQHGSPIYEKEVISNNPNFISLYSSIMTLKDFLRNKSNEKYKRMI